MWEIVVMLILEVMGVGSNTLNKAAINKAQGLMSNYVFTTYSSVIAFCCLFPIALLSQFRRANLHPPISCFIILRIFLLSLICYCYSVFLLIGLSYSSPTLASAMCNLSPAITFTIATIFRMESFNLRAHSTQLKLIGTLVSIGGAFIITFYQGWPIIIFSGGSSLSGSVDGSDTTLSPPLIIFLSSHNNSTLHLLFETQPNWTVGGFFLVASTIFLSLMYIIKTWIARDFNSEVIIALINILFMTTLGAIVTLIAEKDTKAWIPTNHVELIAILFAALVVGTSNVGTVWACRKKGPLFVAMFKPIEMIIAAIMGVFFLKDTLYFGSIVGGVIIALGFYTVMKGKADEEKLKQIDKNKLIDKSQVSSDNIVPLLMNKSMDV